ncbi:CopG family transcriptional regulator [Corynebacterium sp. 13CS0277]|uniref:CopG family transcriptional regulator n=1 Tax=Corynebacterium sp. 13CS0277 TaxID=2071994 RepID=UPI000D032E13|nr:CopG family transcriptional regulator [Corynebacterium sp. 13CS0277]PRQ11105.1 CopG family transcriptional regulator [Corynebacterium sp. 13CS0277]
MAMTLRLTPEQDRALTLLAAVEGTSKQEAARNAIVAAAARTVADEEIRALARTHVEAYAATLYRLRSGR